MQTEAERAARNRLYKRRIWTHQLRPGQLRKKPRCEFCGEPATDVDHKVPHNGDWRLFTDRRNLRSLCRSCHSRKTRGAPAKGSHADGMPLAPDHPWNRG